MAVDEALMGSLALGGGPTLRFYAWSPQCFSIGRFQHALDLTAGARAELGRTWVRRPTGGRALLHAVEVTYSVAAPLDERAVGGSVLESYRKIADALLHGLALLGVRAELAPAADPEALRGNPSCFDSPSDYEILVDGRKLVGSAQMRRRHALLQHGSILLEGCSQQSFEGLAFPDEPVRAVAAAHGATRAVSLAEVLGSPPTRADVKQAVIEGFRGRLGIEAAEGELSDSEQAEARRLCESKYRSHEWSYRL